MSTRRRTFEAGKRDASSSPSRRRALTAPAYSRPVGYYSMTESNRANITAVAAGRGRSQQPLRFSYSFRSYFSALLPLEPCRSADADGRTARATVGQIRGCYSYNFIDKKKEKKTLATRYDLYRL
ncbi:hypothetical protein EVAR_47792_1 [Eumeta japonica]|uniref:Uncharacterized protein n=1 Tax=Eumeta variegata TaxID=151549 RepID=A0A4C1ZCS4_EUMVA|nr:hypothetical protein EVAR_47792_1 [Eumeta japonica]